MMKLKLFFTFVLVFMLVPLCYSQPLENEYYPNGNPRIAFEMESDGQTLRRTEYFQNGVVKNIGQFVNGNLSGYYKENFANGQSHIEMSYKDGTENGPFKEFFENGQLKSDGEYLDGKLNGLQNIYFNDGKLSQVANYYNDTLHGEIKIYYPNGQIRQLSTYQYGKLWGPFKIYSENGSILSDRTYIEDRQQGVFLSYYDNGVIQESGLFKDDKITLLQSYNANGILIREVNFKDEFKNGKYFEYYDSGILKKRAVFKDDEETTTQLFDEFGSMIQEVDETPAPSNSLLGSFNNNALIILLASIFVSILGTALIMGGYYRNLRPKTIIAQDTQLNLPEDTPTDKDEFLKLIDPTSDKMYRGLIETVRSGIYLSDNKGTLIYCNNTFAQLLGYHTKPETSGLNLDRTFSDLSRHEKGFIGSLEGSNAVYDYTFEYMKKDGSYAVLTTSANNIFNDRGDVIGVQGVVFDITEKSLLEETLYSEKKKLELLMDFFETIDTIKDMETLTRFVIDEISEILESNRCSLMLADEDPNVLRVCEAKGMEEDIKEKTKIDWGEPIAGKVAKEGRPLLIKNIEYDEKLKGLKKPSYQGRSLMAAPLLFNDKIIGVICVTDKKNEIMHGEPYNNVDLKMLVTIASKVVIALENVRIYSDLNLLSHTDPITKIYNYRLFNQSLDQEIARYKREKGNLAIFMMDLDSFKSYNDTYGHIEGDELLKNLGKILKENLRETDIVCRYAGDEFCVVLPDTAIEGAINAAEKVVKGVREFPHFKRTVTISIGIASYKEGQDKKEFIKCADAALYDAKHSGKNTVKVYQG